MNERAEELERLRVVAEEYAEIGQTVARITRALPNGVEIRPLCDAPRRKLPARGAVGPAVVDPVVQDDLMANGWPSFVDFDGTRHFYPVGTEGRYRGFKE